MQNSTSVDSKDFLKRMTDMRRQQWARAIVNRMMEAWKVSGHKALAEILGIHGNTPSNWIQKKAVPWTVIYTCHKETTVSLDWLYDGKKPDMEITDSLCDNFERSAKGLLSASGKMGLIKEASKGGFDAVATGLTANFSEQIRAAAKS